MKQGAGGCQGGAKGGAELLRKWVNTHGRIREIPGVSGRVRTPTEARRDLQAGSRGFESLRAHRRLDARTPDLRVAGWGTDESEFGGDVEVVVDE
jgi:hypothetical protein